VQLIPLTQGQFAIIDDADLHLVEGRTWWALWNKNSKTFYAVTGHWDCITKRDVRIPMHRLLLGVTDPKIHVDHKNHKGLDNQRDNLRLCTPATNNYNRRKILSTGSQFKGVRKNHRGGKWRAYIYHKTKFIGLGSYPTEVEAAEAYNAAAIRIHGEFSFLNSIPNKEPINDISSPESPPNGGVHSNKQTRLFK